MIAQRVFPCLLVLFVSFSILLSSCGTTTIERMYSGDPRPDEEIARIEPWGEFVWIPSSSTKTFILAVDGQEVDGDIAEVLPGHHSVEWGARFTLGNARSEYRGVIAFDAQAGHSYVLMAAQDADIPIPFVTGDPELPSVWVEEKQTQTVVAGRRPEQ